MQYLVNPFHGKLSRGGWWFFQFVIFGLAFVGLILTAMFVADPYAPASERNSGEVALFYIIVVLVIYANCSTCLNRLRDSGRSGLWYLSFLVPYAGTGLMVYFCGIEASDDSGALSKPRPPRHFAGNGSRTRNQVFGRG